MKDKITVADGRELTWDEFSALSDIEQSQVMMPSKAPEVNLRGAYRPTKKELLPRIRAAAESNKISENDLLAFIKIVHDIFFPPVPVPEKDAELMANRVTKKFGGAFVQQSKRVMTPMGEFPSQAAAARAYNVEGARIRAWIKKGDRGFGYAD